MSLNQVQLIGRPAKAPERSSEKAPVKFSMATNNRYKGADGQWVDETTWHNIVVWGKLGEVAIKYVTKGKEVYIGGRINNRKYEDKSGVTKYISEIIADKLVLIGGKSENAHGNNTGPAQPAEAYANTEEINIEDIPF